jgi:ligand-binding sensor domain-containing protein|tara:strand:- start:11 stop:406 length:396 start_codon:yes stop_codon:yes gene_type:complete
LCQGSVDGYASDLADQRNVIFDHLDTRDGLSHTVVETLTQDQHGFIWIGTQEGLNRYDGYGFETFHHLTGDPKSLSHDFVWDLLEDSNGDLWVATDEGLNRFNPRDGSFERIAHGVDSHDRSGSVLLDTDC